RRFTLPMTMFSDSVHKLIPKSVCVSLSCCDESRSKFKFVCSRNLISSSHDAGGRKKLDAGSAGRDRLAVLVSLVQKVSDFRFAFERRHAGFSVRNIERVEQN